MSEDRALRPSPGADRIGPARNLTLRGAVDPDVATGVATVLRPAGDLCEDTLAPFTLALGAARGEVVIDLTEVTMLSAAAMRELVRARQRGATVWLRNAGPLVARALAVCGLDDLLSPPRP